MILDYKRFKPIRTFGYIITAIGIFGAFLLLAEWNDPNFTLTFKLFSIFMTVWHLLTGLGILLRISWGFYLLKFYLYVLMLGIPIGTLIAKKILDYMRDNEIESFFLSQEIQL
ncbi:hypothetical protein KA005_74160 [bacterium]|nr:hypothetical protein [bacterium]